MSKLTGVNSSTPDTAPADKREAIKWHNRRSIIAAAAELAAEKGFDGFSVNELAQRAGVSRRTIFNHFPSAEDAVYEHYTEVVGVLIGEVAQALTPPEELPEDVELADVFGELVGVLRAADLTSLLEPLLTQVMDVQDRPTTAMWSEKVQVTAMVHVRELLSQRLPDYGAFELRIVAGSLITAINLAMDEWARRTGARITEDAREIWSGLFETAVNRLSLGFGVSYVEDEPEEQQGTSTS